MITYYTLTSCQFYVPKTDKIYVNHVYSILFKMAFSDFHHFAVFFFFLLALVYGDSGDMCTYRGHAATCYCISNVSIRKIHIKIVKIHDDDCYCNVSYLGPVHLMFIRYLIPVSGLVLEVFVVCYIFLNIICFVFSFNCFFE